MHHDRHFKALIERFAREFLEAFVPDLAAALEEAPLEPLDPSRPVAPAAALITLNFLDFLDNFLHNL